MNIVEWINTILVSRESWDSFSDTDKKSFNSYIINRWLSMDKDFIELVNYFQKYVIGGKETVGSRELYKFYINVLPKGKRFNKYIKGKLDKKYDSELIDMICKHFECSKLQSKEILQLIDKEELKEILGMYGLDNKKIRKFIK
jgi:hypothetical protein